MDRRFFVYIMTNPRKTVLYTGVTNNLLRRVHEYPDVSGPPALPHPMQEREKVDKHQIPIVKSNHPLRALLPAWGRPKWGIPVGMVKEPCG